MELDPNKAYLVKVNGEIREIKPKNGSDFALEEAQGYVAGYIEVVYLSQDQIMIVDEEGKFSKESNVFATAICQLHRVLGAYDYIAGDAVVCPSSMLK